MATTFGGVLLKGRQEVGNAGIIVELEKSPSSDFIIQIDSDWTVEFHRKLQYAIARTSQNLSRQAALEEGINAVQKSLDILCVTEHQKLRVHNYERDHIVWYVEDGRSIIRALTISGLGMSMKVSATVTRADGTIEEPDLYPVPKWHECFRYYRLAQVSDDPFDAFRNLWLSLELAFSLKSGFQKGEREVDWLKRVGQIFEGTLPPSAWPHPGTNPSQFLVDEHYVDTRCRLFHAKDGKSRLNPFVAEDRRIVIERFCTLQPFVRAVLADVANAPTGGGVVTYQGFRHMMESAHGNGLILLSDSQDRLDKAETTSSPCWTKAILLPGPRMDHESIPGLELRGERIETHRISPIEIRRIGLASQNEAGTPDTLFTASQRSSPLVLGADFDAFEAICGIELVNETSPRTRFKL